MLVTHGLLNSLWSSILNLLLYTLVQASWITSSSASTNWGTPFFSSLAAIESVPVALLFSGISARFQFLHGMLNASMSLNLD
jgi:hypothetical protein